MPPWLTDPHNALAAGLAAPANLWLAAAAVLAALAVDWLLGEPPVRCHPVVVMGRYLGAVGARIAPLAGSATKRRAEFWRGFGAWWVGAWAVAGLAFAIDLLFVRALAADGPAQGLLALLLGLALKPLLSWRLLHHEVRAVETALATSVAQGRARVAWLVSRDVRELDATQVREAALSTLAENLNDSVVAPLFWFVVAGLPGAAVYRFANTADAMWGYQGEHQGRVWTWAGQWAARADDVLSWLPARLTAGFLGCVMWRITPPSAWPTYWTQVCQQSRLTPSPNSGWPMAALSLGMGIRLQKTGVYQLNPQGRPPAATDTALALRHCAHVVWVLVGLAGVPLVVVALETLGQAWR